MTGPKGIARRRGPLRAGDLVQVTDPKGRQHIFTLAEGGSFHTHRGTLAHDALIGRPEGSTLQSSGGTTYLALRPLLPDYALTMPRGAAVIYPKEAAQVIGMADIFGGARVVEAGAGSGALTSWLLSAVGEEGAVFSFERREDFAEVARRNVTGFFGDSHPAWTLTVGELTATLADTLGAAELNEVDRVVLDMLSPWECVDAASTALTPGGVICCYVTTTTQLARTVEALRGHGTYTEPTAWETLVRNWHVEGLAVRPDHRMVGHTGFLVIARRLAEGVTPLPRRRRPAKSAYSGS